MTDKEAAGPVGDGAIRAAAAAHPVPELGPTPFSRPPSLERARVAIVTTAALHPSFAAPPRGGDPSFQVLRGGEELTLAHESPNFDRSGWIVDPNVVFPLDRLRELAADGRIGSVAPRHLSFAGNQQPKTLAEIDLDAGPDAARLLREDGVDVVVLTPV